MLLKFKFYHIDLLLSFKSFFIDTLKMDVDSPLCLGLNPIVPSQISQNSQISQ